MQDNNENEIKDEIIDEEDFDLDDFDDDLADDASWDDFDDEATAQPEAAVVPKKASFLKRNFNLIIITAGCLIGGVIIMNQFGSGSQNQTSEQSFQADITEKQPVPGKPAMEEIVELSSKSDLPPMPAPIHNIPKEEARDPLTPMPEIGEIDDSVILEELNIDEPSAVPVDDEILAEAEKQPLEFKPAPEETKQNPEKTMETPESAPEKEPVSAAVDEIEDMNAIEDPLQAQSPQASMSGMAIVTNDIYEKIGDLEEKINTENNVLAASLSETNNRIDELATSISSIEKSVKALAERPVAKPAAAPPPAPVAEKAPSAPVATPPKPAPQKPKPNQVVSNPAPKAEPKDQIAEKWQLRAAQPGKALIAPKGSNEMITVHVGDTIPGLGNISSISVENGKWVIRGDKGIITQ